MTDGLIVIDILPVDRKTGRYDVVARHDGDVVATHSAREGYSAIPGILRKLESLGFSREAGIDFYRGKTLVFLRRTLGAWLSDYDKKRPSEENDEDGE